MRLSNILRIDKLIVLLWMKMRYNIFVHGKWKIDGDEDFMVVGNNCGITGAIIVRLVSGAKLRVVFDREYFDGLRFKFFWRLLGFRAFGTDDEPDIMVRTMTHLGRDIERGRKICLLAGSGITRNENLEKFFKVFDKIGVGEDLNIIPLYVGTSGTEHGNYFNVVIAQTLGAKRVVSVNFGKIMRFDNKHWRVYREISVLMSESFNDLKKYRRPLIELFVRAARKHGSKDCIADSTDKSLNYTQTLTAGIIAADKMKNYVGEHKYVGVLLPPCVGAVLSNFGLCLLGRVAVNLNYSIGDDARELTSKKAELDTIITSRKFLERISIDPDDQRFVFIEDLLKNVSGFSKLFAYLRAKFLPVRLLSGYKNFNADDDAAVLFSSGSSGDPKGIVLSHHNIISNIEQMERIFKIYDTDRLCGVLPFFHSFGYTVSFWLSLLSGVATYYVTNPLDAGQIGKAVQKHRSTILFATPTFVQSYTRRIEREKFGTLRTVIVGAEKLRSVTADEFYDKFGVSVKQGYGTTELSPVVAVNPEDDLVIGKGNKPETVGFVIPGTSAKIVDVEHGNECEPGEIGRVLLYGPSVMKGYLGDEELTERSFVDGWYDTNDIGSLDDDRYLGITDRLARFSKIGGEMVSHLKIEEVIFESTGVDKSVAVTGLQDDKKGEQLVVLCCRDLIKAKHARDIIEQSSLANINKPKPENYFEVDQLPLLGSGKLDIMGVKSMAKNLKGISN